MAAVPRGLAKNREATAKYRVGEADTAAGFGSDFPHIASTPYVLGLAEVTSHQAAAPLLGPDDITVGVRADIEHLLPTKVGSTLTVHSVLTKRLKRRLYFRITVSEGDKTVARIRHTRAITSADRFRVLVDG